MEAFMETTFFMAAVFMEDFMEDFMEALEADFMVAAIFLWVFCVELLS